MSSIVDSHLHFVNLDRFQYYWMNPEFSVLQHNFLAEDVRPLYEVNDVEQAVLVQAHPSREESEYLVEVATTHHFIGAVIAHVDLISERIDEDLAELSRHGVVKGVRHQRAEDKDANWFLEADVVRGLRAVAQAGLIYDLLVRSQHLSSIPVLLEKVPDLKVVLEHMGKPPIASGAIEPWAGNLTAIARNPSIFCKLSELVTQADWSNWSNADLKPYAQHALECFGPKRLMWGSGWPVCLLAADFERTLISSLEALGPLSKSELDCIFNQTARSFYNLV